MNNPQAIDELLSELPDVLTPEEVADLMRVSVDTVARWAKQYGLQVLDVGPRMRRVRKVDLRAFLLSGDEIPESSQSPKE